MKKTAEVVSVVEHYTSYGLPQEIDSTFRLIVIASLRSKQLQRGARPRIETDTSRRKNTNIAIEEARRGLIHYKLIDENGVAIVVQSPEDKAAQ